MAGRTRPSPASARASPCRGFRSSADGSSRAATCASRSCATRIGSPSTDPRFSTGQVVGPSMLSLDGDAHRRHRDPFARAFLAPETRGRFAEPVTAEARRLVERLAPNGRAEVRRDLAGRSRSTSSSAALGLLDVDPAVVLGWYERYRRRGRPRVGRWGDRAGGAGRVRVAGRACQRDHLTRRWGAGPGDLHADA